jgi:hypothetical protein
LIGVRWPDGPAELRDLAVAIVEKLFGLGSREVITLPEPPHVGVDVRLDLIKELPSDDADPR